MLDTAKLGNPPLHTLLSHDLVDIYVGSDNTHWILHEKLLCARSKFFSKIFQSKETKDKHQSASFGLPDEDDESFAAFVSWLYGGGVRSPREEKDLTVLFDLYLMGEKWAVGSLVADTLTEVREWYARTDTYPGLRRVQYVYANTDEGSALRRLLVHSVARMLALSDRGIPQHWDKALRKNGQLAVDIIRAIQEWRIDALKVPDPRHDPESAIPNFKADDVDGVDLDGAVDEAKTRLSIYPLIHVTKNQLSMGNTYTPIRQNGTEFIFLTILDFLSMTTLDT
ncbi:hypothetical protein IWZ01DRAFT_533727 [Phyllosticta capitalensis]